MSLTNACEGCFAGLACSSRIDIINLLEKNKKMNVSEIGKHFKISQPTITHHLQYLKAVGLIDSKKEGRKVYYFIHPKCGKKSCGVLN